MSKNTRDPYLDTLDLGDYEPQYLKKENLSYLDVIQTAEGMTDSSLEERCEARSIYNNIIKDPDEEGYPDDAEAEFGLALVLNHELTNPDEK